MPATLPVQYVSDENGDPIIVPTDIWHEIESEREPASSFFRRLPFIQDAVE